MSEKRHQEFCLTEQLEGWSGHFRRWRSCRGVDLRGRTLEDQQFGFGNIRFEILLDINRKC